MLPWVNMINYDQTHRDHIMWCLPSVPKFYQPLENEQNIKIALFSAMPHIIFSKLPLFKSKFGNIVLLPISDCGYFPIF